MAGTPDQGSFVIVEPGPGDRDGWASLWSGYCAFYAVPDTPEKADTVWAWLMDPAHPVKAFVAQDEGGAIIGFTHYRPYPRPVTGSTACFLDDLFVSAEARGRGVGGALIARVVEQARVRGWSVVRWITAEDNVRARSVYDRMADRTRWVTYEIRP